MTYKNRNSFIALGVIFGLAILIATLSTGKSSNAQNKVAETLDAKPLHRDEKKERSVLDPSQNEIIDITPHPDKKDSDPSLTLFQDKDKPTSSDQLIENYNEMMSSTEQHQGSALVPESIRSSSVQVLKIPLGKSESEEENKK